MSTIVREINGIRGFCMYKNGQPYTYIYTRDAIEMLGLVEIKKNNTKKLRIKSFGEKYLFVTKNDIRLKDMSPSDYGIDITPNYSISIDRSMDEITGASCCAGDIIAPIQIRLNDGTIVNISKYDDILPEYILDRVVFSIANKLRSSTAEEFRSALIWEVIPHFQQTATQDQIAKVPILNQTTQFMYDNRDIFLVTKQSYDFAMQVLNMYVNRLAVLINESDLDKVFSKLAGEYNEILTANEENNLIYYLERYINYMQSVSGVKHERNLLNLKEAIIYNWRLFSDFTSFIFKKIREEEEFIVRDRLNGEKLIEYRPTSMSERLEYYRVPKEPGKISPVRFLSMDERAGLV